MSAEPAFGRRRMRRSNPFFACCIRGAMDCFAGARNDGCWLRRDREVMFDKTPLPPRALARGGEGSGVGGGAAYIEAANSAHSALNSHCRESCRSKMSTIVPVEHARIAASEYAALPPTPDPSPPLRGRRGETARDGRVPENSISYVAPMSPRLSPYAPLRIGHQTWGIPPLPYRARAYIVTAFEDDRPARCRDRCPPPYGK